MSCCGFAARCAVRLCLTGTAVMNNLREGSASPRSNSVEKLVGKPKAFRTSGGRAAKRRTKDVDARLRVNHPAANRQSSDIDLLRSEEHTSELQSHSFL